MDFAKLALLCAALAAASALQASAQGSCQADGAAPFTGGSAEADAAELAAVLGRYRAEQDEFCAKLASTSGPAMGIISNASYARHPGVALVGGGGASYVMWTQPRTTDLVSQEIWNSGSWDVNETSAMLDSLREWGQMNALAPEEVVLLDVGANVGWYTLQAAAAGYSVIAVEPMATNVGAIRRTLCENPEMRKRVTLIPKGLSRKPDRCRFMAFERNTGNGVAVCDSDENKLSQGRDKYLVIGEFELVPLDSVFSAGAARALAGRLAAVKVDVEGFEPQVFAGARRFMGITRPRHILAEVLHGDPRFGRVPPGAMLKMFDQLGYQIRLDDWEGEALDPGTLGRRATQLVPPWSELNVFLVRYPASDCA